jgi:hypothetical protein
VVIIGVCILPRVYQLNITIRVQQDTDIISSILKINSILIPLILFLNIDLNILAFYTTTCFRITVTTILPFYISDSTDPLIY